MIKPANNDADNRAKNKIVFGELTIITGHYGCGKTNLAVNIALAVQPCVIADLDIVNPYFRTADLKKLFGTEAGIELAASRYANSTLDLPSLAFGLDGLTARDKRYVLDVGGDDDGATALGRYAALFARKKPEMLYVINKYRYLTGTPEAAVALMRDIEASARLKCTGIINNSNLGVETTRQTVEDSLEYAHAAAKLAGIPLKCTAAKRGLFPEDAEGIFPVDVLVGMDWGMEIAGEMAGR
jgi:energy-coupling factor transporter ATP-binding protein EcfA2